jgi:hypothetical protein
VHPTRTGCRKRSRDINRFRAVDGLPGEIAFGKTHHVPTSEVYRRQKREASWQQALR